ncbi:MAG TPA: Clp protease N-terminal domain-containing protein [Acidimicrobiales bacterium]|nr:Clp protease N-terminal domain-containing protein [Acidimicrobiales bacterium]
MFERFSDEARRTVVRALVEARRLGHDYVGTEHTLVALVEARGAAANALASEGVTVDRARLAVADVVGRGRGVSPWDDGPFTARARHAFELCKREAYEFGHRYIASGHVLLALLPIGDSNAVRALRHLTVDLDTLRQKVEDSIGTERPPVAPTEHRTYLGRYPTIGGLPVDDTATDDLLDDAYQPEAEAEPAPEHVVVTPSRPELRPEPPPEPERRCSFCTRPVDDRDSYVAGAEALICAECVRAAVRLIGDEPEVALPALDGPAPDDEAVLGVAHAFVTVFDPTGDDDERAVHLEDGELLAPLLTWAHERYPAAGAAVVERVRFLTDDLALATYTLDLGPGPALSRSGWARRHPAGWQVTRDTFTAALHHAGIPPL